MEQQAVNSDPMSIAISPLAMPLFAGPGTITTALSPIIFVIIFIKFSPKKPAICFALLNRR